MHQGGVHNDWGVVGNSLLLLGWGYGSGERMDEEKRGLVHYADDRGRRGSVLDSPAPEVL